MFSVWEQEIQKGKGELEENKMKEMIKAEWLYEWFEKIKKEKGEYVSGNTLDGNFPLNELADYLNEKLKKERVN